MLILSAPAKINLALDVVSKRPDGYHEVDMILQTIALADQLVLENHNRIELICSDQRLSVDSSNLIWKAASLLKEKTGFNGGAKIHLTKNIPIAAGLAGGSSDAAATLVGLNQLWELGLTRDDLMRLGLNLGADVPFCILQGTARAKGIGEKLTPINSKLTGELLLVTPNIPVPTPFIYHKLQLNNISYHPNVNGVVSALEEGNLSKIYSNWGNVLQEVAFQEFPNLTSVREFFQKYGLAEQLMSGSGPTIFAIHPPKELVQTFLKDLPDGWFGCLTHFII